MLAPTNRTVKKSTFVWAKVLTSLCSAIVSILLWSTLRFDSRSSMTLVSPSGSSIVKLYSSQGSSHFSQVVWPQSQVRLFERKMYADRGFFIGGYWTSNRELTLFVTADFASTSLNGMRAQYGSISCTFIRVKQDLTALTLPGGMTAAVAKQIQW